MEKSNIQLECRLWAWSWASARALICTSAHRFRTRMMSKQAVHTNSKFPRHMDKIKFQTRVQAGRMHSVDELNWMLASTQWMAGEWSNTYRLRGRRQLPDGHHLECRCAEELQGTWELDSIYLRCHSRYCQRMGMSRWEVCTAVIAVGALHLKTCLVRVSLLWAWRFGVHACAHGCTSELQLGQRAMGSSTCPTQMEK